MRIGKILIDSDHDTHEAKVVYAKFPEDIAKRKVLLMYPIMSKLKKKKLCTQDLYSIFLLILQAQVTQ